MCLTVLQFTSYKQFGEERVASGREKGKKPQKESALHSSDLTVFTKKVLWKARQEDWAVSVSIGKQGVSVSQVRSAKKDNSPRNSTANKTAAAQFSL